jgi:ferredoxin
MKVKIDKDKCLGCGTCAALYEELFEIGEDGMSQIKEMNQEKIDKEKVKQAQDSCPTGAIVVED